MKPDILTIPEYNSDISVVLNKGCSFDGKLSFEGIARIDGIFSGEIFSNDTLIIGEGAKVKALIEANTVVVGGYFEGKIIANSRLELKYPCIFVGETIAPILQIDEGVIFNGSSKMSNRNIISR